MDRLSLPGVTLCAIASINVEATVSALRKCLESADFGVCRLLTDAAIVGGGGICVVPIRKIRTAAEYSQFLLTELIEHVQTPHCLIIQWDGFILDADAWDSEFLQYDYIGASWPQFTDGRDVGNGGFSLRSRKLLEVCRDHRFQLHHPEDVAICRTNRDLLEQSHGIRFANRPIADRFAFERTVPSEKAFGFHGIFNMIRVLGVDQFWSTYRKLDDRSTALADFRAILSELGPGPAGFLRRLVFVIYSIRDWLRGLARS
jgi:hypothetical protein